MSKRQHQWLDFSSGGGVGKLLDCLKVRLPAVQNIDVRMRLGKESGSAEDGDHR